MKQRLLRLRWLVYGQWHLMIWKAWRRATCKGHVPYSVQVGTMQEFMDGGEGHQRVMCAYCFVTLADYA